jgi:hypothetical protein
MCWWLYKTGIVYKCSPNQLTHATTLPRYGMGLCPKFICFSVRSLVLYKGLYDPGIRVAARLWAIVNRDPSGFIRPEDTWVLLPWHWSYTRDDGGRLPGFAGEVNSIGQAPVLR